MQFFGANSGIAFKTQVAEREGDGREVVEIAQTLLGVFAPDLG